MHERDSWPRRTSRGLLCASAGMCLGAISHVAAGGSLPGVRGLLFLFTALTVLGTVLLGGRRRRFDVTTLVLGASQFGLHLAFHQLSMIPSGAAAGQHAVPGHHGDAHAHMHPAEMAHAGAGSGHSMTAAMTSAHALATLGTALCVIYGERVLRHLAALVLPRLDFSALGQVPVPPERRMPVPPTDGHVHVGVLLARSHPRRGPPLVTSA
ncbi:hypothetical protein [Streptomyces vietnamensis]|uniref:hypothetical protein n=1 Tax=Streptomyces vietnamensis TaxID=362257 RepID=UPI001FE121B5|nr:hypothetical protein [Streptomyces vietnamensis]